MYRIPGIDGRPDDVRVDDDGISVPLEEALYRARQYEPCVDDLPWRDDYLARQASVTLPPIMADRVSSTRSAMFRRYGAR